MEIEELCYDINELTLHGLSTGSDDAPVTLCLHGWLDNAASFLPLLPYFTDRKLIAIDWPGHGFSSHRSADAHYHFIDWVYDLVQLFELNKWEKIDIIGHSMGGMVATAFAAAFPEKVRSLTLLDSIGFVSADAQTTTEQLRKGLASRIKGQNKQKNHHESIDSAIAARVAVGDLSTELTSLIVKRGIAKIGNHYTWRSDSRLRNTSPYRLTLEQAKQLMTDVKCPVNLIYGEKGLDMVHLGVKEFSNLFKDLSLSQLPGGHHLHMESPEPIAENIVEFWQGLVE